MRLFGIIAYFFLLPFMLTAQNQKAITLLDKSANVLKTNTGIEASFLLKDQMSDPKATHSFEGVLKSRQNKFMIDMPDVRTWFDGTTQWSYLKSNKEVNVTNPTEEEIAAINPISLLQLYKHGYRPAYKGEQTVKGAPIADIELTAENKNMPWRKINLRLNTKTYLPASILIHDKNGRSSEIIFLKVKQNLNLSDSNFVFNQGDYPDAEIIDLR